MEQPWIKDTWPPASETPPIEGVEIVEMKKTHLKMVLQIENESFPIPWSMEAFDYDLSQNDLAHYWVVRLKDRVIGYSGIWLVGNIAHITTICITGKYRGKGLGKWLLLKTMETAENLGAMRFTLEVRETNTEAIRLYESVGYRVVGRRRNYYREIGEDALVMWTGKPPYEA